MFGNFFRKGHMEENLKADAGYVQDAASSLWANVDRTAKIDEQFDHASLSPDEDRWVDQRAPERPEDRVLSPKTQAWFDFLPRGERPHNLANRYPRICNRIVERWAYPDLMIRFFDALLMDARGGRRGFPMTIAIEIARLKEHYLATGGTKKGDVWNRVIASRMS